MLTEQALASSTPGCHLFSGCGFPAPTTGIFAPAPYATFTVFGLEVAITKPMILLVLGSALILGTFMLMTRRMALIPGRGQSVAELAYVAIRDQVARGSIPAKQADRFVPFLFALFFFVWILNFMGIFPAAQFPVTSRLAIPAVLAIMVWLVFNWVGIRKHGFVGYFKGILFPSGVPWYIYIILTPIEFASTILIRPLTLAVRLFANMVAGHLLLVTFSVAAYYLLTTHGGATGMLAGGGFSLVSFIGVVAFTGFEVLIQFIQAFVFILLTASYIGGALEEAH